MKKKELSWLCVLGSVAKKKEKKRKEKKKTVII
jgi:hypothetical protein